MPDREIDIIHIPAPQAKTPEEAKRRDDLFRAAIHADIDHGVVVQGRQFSTMEIEEEKQNLDVTIVNPAGYVSLQPHHVPLPPALLLGPISITGENKCAPRPIAPNPDGSVTLFGPTGKAAQALEKLRKRLARETPPAR